VFVLNNRLYKDKIPYVKSSCRSGNYLYTANFSQQEEALCRMELKYLFNSHLENKHFFTSEYVDPSRSPFIKHCISIRYEGSRLEDIIQQLINDNFYAENFKVYYINLENEILSFHKSREIEYSIGLNIKGNAKMKNPEVVFGIAKASGKWVFGECESNEYSWQSHKIKPYSYSNALNVEVSRALVNIAAGNNNITLVDPCCGIGTVVIEALSMGINIKGHEINPHIGGNAKENLKHFGFKDVITIGDMNAIDCHFNAAIVDLPYGLFTSATLAQQVNIIKCVRKITDKMLLITFENMDKQIIDSGFEIMDRCSVTKGKFTRYVSLCN